MFKLCHTSKVLPFIEREDQYDILFVDWFCVTIGKGASTHF